MTKLPDVGELSMGELDRPALFDLIAISLGAAALYLLLLLPGVGWGDGAQLQLSAARPALSAASSAAAITPPQVFDTTTGVAPELGDGPGVGVARSLVSDIFIGPARVLIRLIPFGNLAWRFNVLMALLAVGTLVILYLTFRLLVTNRVAAALACIAVIFSHTFFLQAVRPSIYPFLGFLYAAQLHQSVRRLLLGETFPLISVWVFALTGTVLMPDQSLAVLAPALFVTLRDVTRHSWIFWCLFLPTLAATHFLSAFGAAALPVLIVYLALQYPVMGWILMPWGARALGRRLRPILELVAVALVAAPPCVLPTFLPDALGSLLRASLAASVLVAMGAEYVLERVKSRRELALYAPPLFCVVLAVLPLVTTMALASTVRASGWDSRLAMDRPFGIILRDTPWCDAVWYALWPPKNGQGGERFLVDAEAQLPVGSFLLADPEILPVVAYAQQVEGRLRGVTAEFMPLSAQARELGRRAAGGQRIFLAGIDPAFYDGATLGLAGDMEQVGNLYEWVPHVTPDTGAVSLIPGAHP